MIILTVFDQPFLSSYGISVIPHKCMLMCLTFLHLCGQINLGLSKEICIFVQDVKHLKTPLLAKLTLDSFFREFAYVFYVCILWYDFFIKYL